MSSQQPEPSKAARTSGVAKSIDAKSWGLGVVGAVIGGAIGWFVFSLLYNEGFYALALPGALVGYGFGMLSRRRSFAAGVFCAIAAAGLMLVCEWQTYDATFIHFVQNLQELSTATFLLFILGVVMAFWFGKGS